MNKEELEGLYKSIKKEISEYHEAEPDISDEVLELVKTEIEMYYKDSELSWPWFDYDYSREWDFYTLETSVDHEENDESCEAKIYAEAYPVNGEYSLVYLMIDEEVIIDNREKIPEDIIYDSIQAEKERIEKLAEQKEDEEHEGMGTEELEGMELEEEILTIDNCPELKAILLNKADMDPSYADFAVEYEHRIIEFDGYISDLAKHENFKTRYDVLINYDNPNGITGPYFQFWDVNTADMHISSDTLKVNDKVKVKAKVENYNDNTGLFILDPVEVVVK